MLRFPDQHLDLGELKHFSEQFGEIQGPATRGRDPTQEYPEIDILSNLKEAGKYIGSPDAGQDWHLSQYRKCPGRSINISHSNAIFGRWVFFRRVLLLMVCMAPPPERR